MNRLCPYGVSRSGESCTSLQPVNKREEKEVRVNASVSAVSCVASRYRAPPYPSVEVQAVKLEGPRPNEDWLAPKVAVMAVPLPLPDGSVMFSISNEVRVTVPKEERCMRDE